MDGQEELEIAISNICIGLSDIKFDTELEERVLGRRLLHSLHMQLKWEFWNILVLQNGTHIHIC